jgi:transcriptional regulator GlxA family with amidase domain
MEKHLVVALAYDRLCTFEFGCTVELFALDRPELGVQWYDFAVCAIEPGPIRAAGGITLSAPHTPELITRADTIVIPGWRDADEEPPPALLALIRAAHQRGARLCSICSGVFVLAAAGVLDGLRATTHWRYAEKLARLMDWVRAHPAAQQTIKSMAERAAMSPRTLQRQFRDATGLGPIEWLIHERVAIVKELLEVPGMPLAQVAERAGFGSEESLRHHFRRLTATTPGAYRRQFAHRI